MHLVGFIIRICHDVQSSECEIHIIILFCIVYPINILHKFNVMNIVVTLWSGIWFLMFWWYMLPHSGGGGSRSSLQNIISYSVSSESSPNILFLF
jgi:hypothetical protein